MRRGEGACRLDSNGDDLTHTQLAMQVEQRSERPTLDILQHDKGMLRVIRPVIDPQNRRVTESSNGTCFSGKSLTETLIAGEFLVEHAHGNLALQGDVITEIGRRVGSAS